MTDTPRRRQRRPTLSYALAQAKKAGFIPTGATVAPDGAITLQFPREIEKAAADNPWDEVLEREHA